MKVIVQYDACAEASLGGMDIVAGLIGKTLVQPLELCGREDPYAVYQVNGRIDPRRIVDAHVRTAQKTDDVTLVLTGYDLSPAGLNFSYGMSWEGVLSVVSTYRLLGSPIWTAVMALHEIFHQLGLVNAQQPQYDHRTGFAGHCRNRCLMRAINGEADLKAVIADWVAGIGLCVQCSGG